jgi:hypothetical protein
MTTHRTYSGKEVRVKHSNIKARARFQLDFPALPTAEMLEIIAHYRKQKGGFASFTIPDAVANAMDFPADFTPAGNEWIYIGKPRVADIPLPGGSPSNRHNVTVDIESVPATSTTILPRFRWRLKALPPVVTSAFVDSPASGFTMESLAPVARNSFPALAFPPTTGFTLTGLIPVVVSDPSPFDPLTLSPGAWWDLSDAGTVTTSSGNIRAVTDKSGGGRTLEWVNGFGNIAYATAAVNGLNAAQYVSSNNGATLRNLSAMTFTAQEVYVVLQYSGGSQFTNYDGIFGSGNAVDFWISGNNVGTGLQPGGPFNNAFINGGSTNRFSNVFPEIQSPCLLRITAPSPVSTTAGVYFGVDRIYNYFSRSWSGNICELLAFPATLSSGGRSDLETYLMGKWGI